MPSQKKILHVVVDVEADGPCPHLYSMTEFGAVVVEPCLQRTFHGQCRPVAPLRDEKVLAVSGRTYDEADWWPMPETTIPEFFTWLNTMKGERPRLQFWSDNPAFDWQFINYYLHRYAAGNPFGFSARDIGALYKGCKRSLFHNFKHLRRTKHTHHPLDDAKGNAEALLAMADEFDIKGMLDA